MNRIEVDRWVRLLKEGFIRHASNFTLPPYDLGDASYSLTTSIRSSSEPAGAAPSGTRGSAMAPPSAGEATCGGADSKGNVVVSIGKATTTVSSVSQMPIRA